MLSKKHSFMDFIANPWKSNVLTKDHKIAGLFQHQQSREALAHQQRAWIPKPIVCQPTICPTESQNDIETLLQTKTEVDKGTL